jgi:enoyl-CoA hydratase/carnithine racemase
MSGTVQIRVDDKVGTLALDNFAKRNALGAETVQELMDALGISGSAGCGRSSCGPRR